MPIPIPESQRHEAEIIIDALDEEFERDLALWTEFATMPNGRMFFEVQPTEEERIAIFLHPPARRLKEQDLLDAWGNVEGPVKIHEYNLEMERLILARQKNGAKP